MAVMIVFVAAIAIIAALYLSRQRLAAKPWLEAGVAGASPVLEEFPGHTARIGLFVFLAVASSLFALLVSAYFMRMDMPDWRPLPSLGILWLNTGFLVAGSLGLQGAASAARHGRMDTARLALAAGAFMTLAFVAGQAIAWYWLLTTGLTPAQNPANAFFFLITGVHGLHVLGGLVVLGRTADHAWRTDRLDELRETLSLCAIYWHFLLFVWLIMLAVLTGTADFFVAFCRGLLPAR
jgi:cytochrome c oxidase subunit 3